MNIEEKLTLFKVKIQPDTASDEMLLAYLNDSKSAILDKRYPFGYAGEIDVPKQYENLQIELAVELFSKRGAEGETSHTENGIGRVYGSSLLKRVMPLFGSVRVNENTTKE